MPTSSNPAIDYLDNALKQFPQLETCWGISILYALYVLKPDIHLDAFIPQLLQLLHKHNKIGNQNGLRKLDKTTIADLNKLLTKYGLKAIILSWDDLYDKIIPANKNNPKPQIIFLPALIVKQEKIIIEKHVYILETRGGQAQVVDATFIKAKPVDLDNLTVQTFKLQIDSERSVYPDPDDNLILWERD